ncbi:hypothetical protein P154DRAFT_84856 [Amniculicola lignicola CBS 123094]|uniref:Uncharacterized protein n=1 Tax=Amniculicola lignicola CBS 123094 TaxID=1392246 RepID=A0A6A5WWE0_9PLEO|nr:hypothetical protein P154DRAFT_84856 [Amniculicola lignicola CBS 123094]
MAANTTQPTTFGATITSPSTQPTLRSAPSNESNMSAASLSPEEKEKEIGIDPSNPFSAFYKHPTARRSLDLTLSQSQLQGTAHEPTKSHLDVHVYEQRDLESGLPLSAATTQQPKVSVDGRVKECTMWPSRQAMLDKQKQTKRSRGCSAFRSLNSKQRLWVKIVIGLVIVAAAVGLGVGISRAVGGGVWSGNGQSKEIPGNKDN